MTTYAYVGEDGQVQGVYSDLPVSWKNISNFHLLDEDKIESYGFYRIQKLNDPKYDPTTTYATAPTYTFTGSGVVEHITLERLPERSRDLDQEWEEVRRIRDQKIHEIEWRYARALRESRMGQKITDDISLVDRYIQALADIPHKFSDPQDVVWPVYGE